MSERDKSAIDDAIEVASTVSGDQSSLLRACRRIAKLRDRLGSVPQDILDPIVAVESELDDVPDELDAWRWESRAFQQRLEERDVYLERVRPLLLRCFRDLVKHLSS